MTTKPLNLRECTIKYLQANTGTSFAGREIAQWIYSTYPEECAAKKANSKGNYLHTADDVIQQLAAEIAGSRPRWQGSHPQLKTTEGRPRRYYWSDKTDGEEVLVAEQETPQPAAALEAISSAAKSAKPAKPATPKLSENDLYPKLAHFLWAEFKVYAGRIDEKVSSNKGASGTNEWLHPDLVGIEDLTAKWARELRECVGVLPERRARLWSFEAKLLVNRSNVRKSYFQTVSNSSWAHLGYLVAGTIEGDGTMKELTMLAATHGIGVIQLDYQNPTESQVLIPARERSEIDWDMCNRLIEENSDFRSFIERLQHFYQIGKIKENDWPLVLPFLQIT